MILDSDTLSCCMKFGWSRYTKQDLLFNQFIAIYPGLGVSKTVENFETFTKFIIVIYLDKYNNDKDFNTTILDLCSDNYDIANYIIAVELIRSKIMEEENK